MQWAKLDHVLDKFDASEIHEELDAVAVKIRALFGTAVPEKIAQIEHFLTGVHGALEQASDSASKENDG